MMLMSSDLQRVIAREIATDLFGQRGGLGLQADQ